MRFIKTMSLVAAAAFSWSALQAQETLLLRSPSISKTHVTFVYGGDIWVADRDGKNPRRLTVNPGMEQNPIFSPDGKNIAFTGNYDGNTDVYVVSVDGGAPKRVTYHPNSDMIRGWINNDEIFFTSTRDYQYALTSRLHSIRLSGGPSSAQVLPEATQGSLSPDGRYWAYIKNSDPTEREVVAFKRYRGGGMPSIWIFDNTTQEIEIVPGTNCNDVKPLWLGNKVYFLSDRDKTVNVFAYDVTTKKVEKLTNFSDYDVKSLQGQGESLVIEQAGKIHIYDIGNKRTQALAIHVQADAMHKRTRYIDMESDIRSFSISPTGQRAIFESRGEVLTVPKEKGEARNLSNTPGAHERFAEWSPNGKYISYISDRNGKYELVLVDQAGKEKPKYFALGDSHFYFQPTWSPDSKKLFYNDSHLNLYYIDIEAGKPVMVDSDKLGSHTGRTYNHFQPTWSPDSKWIGYIKTLNNGVSALHVYEVATKKSTQVTDGMSEVQGPSFSRDGKYLFFSASTNIGLTNSGLHMTAYDRPTSYQVYAWILSKDTPSIFKTESDEEEVKEDKKEEAKEDKKEATADKKPETKPVTAASKDVKIDFEQINSRIIALPLGSGNFTLDGRVEDMLLFRQGPNLRSYNLKTLQNTVILEGLNGYDISADGKKMIYSSRGSYYIINAGQRPINPEQGKLNVSGIKILVDPVAEWQQIYNEVWAMQKDYFYVENMHGADWNAMKTKYQKFVPHVNHRSDLNYLLNDLMGELVVGHAYIYPGDEPASQSVAVGMLGADYKLVSGRYQIAKIYDPLDWNPTFKAPLTEPGLNIKEGEYILAVNGRELTDKINIYSLFENTVGRQVVLTINDKPSMDGSREVTVVPISGGAESGIRQAHWVERNRKRTEELSKGQIAYVYMQNTGREGYTSFNRYYFSQMDKKALLIDERNNGGGSVADYVIDLLTREPISYWAVRDGKPFSTPGNGIFGPKAMIINENAGSGGDMMPYMFRLKNLGKLVGRTTMGILVGISGYPPLIDGGRITSPNFGIYDLDGKWIIENEGVAPDVFVEQSPKDLLQGRDPQLERTVQILLEEMKSYPYKPLKRPVDPVRVK
jgi:tricorn protease